MYLRAAEWDEIARLIPPGRAEILADEWAGRYGLTPVEWHTCPVRLESWSSGQLQEVMEQMTEVNPRMSVDPSPEGKNNATLPPRVQGLPLAVIAFPEGRYGMVDGKHRTHWTKKSGIPHAVLVCEY